MSTQRSGADGQGQAGQTTVRPHLARGPSSEFDLLAGRPRLLAGPAGHHHGGAVRHRAVRHRSVAGPAGDAFLLFRSALLQSAAAGLLPDGGRHTEPARECESDDGLLGRLMHSVLELTGRRDEAAAGRVVERLARPPPPLGGADLHHVPLPGPGAFVGRRPVPRRNPPGALRE